MSTRVSGSSLAQAVKELLIQWEETKAHWHDVKSMSFERTYLEELPGVTSRTALAMEEIEGLLGKVRNDCE
jgi:hypothetical protein